MKKFFLGFAALCSLVANTLQAQVISTKTGHVNFYSKSPLEVISADNYKVGAAIDLTSGVVEFSMLIKGFEFEKALMEEHFNAAEYMHSEKFPKATFKGKILDYKAIDLAKDGTHKVKVAGDMTIHGVTKKIEVEGNIEVKKGKANINSVFNIAVKDYGVIVPGAVATKIAEQLKITVKAIDLMPKKK